MENNSRTDYSIHLNFLPIFSAPPARIFRRLRANDEKKPHEDLLGFRLPKNSEDKEYSSYWVALMPREGFEETSVLLKTNHDLGKRLLFEALLHNAKSILSESQCYLSRNRFIQELSITIEDHPEGKEELLIQPYYLAETKQFGFLVDFHFRLSPGVPFSRRIQQLSLSLNKNFKRNTDYYVDRTAKVRTALINQWAVFEGLQLVGSKESVVVSKDFPALKSERLQSKTFLFRDDKEKRSQFAGLKEYGPLQPLLQSPHLLFIFREQDRQAARRLAIALRGSTQQSQFNWPGFQTIFKSPLEIDSNPLILPDLTKASMESALAAALTQHDHNPMTMPVLVLPNGDDNGYLEQKALFSHSSIPTQVCTLRILEDDDSLKWAVANLALQIFCKLGGKPWKVKEQTNRSLILGISHSHKIKRIDDKTVVEKYFAFSVLTDSTGLFQRIEVLGEAPEQETYLDAVRHNLKGILEKEAASFDRVVIHTSFKLTFEEIGAIRRTVSEAAKQSKCKFSVVKVNNHSRFFGFNKSANSLVPYEGTKTRLGTREYLVWFEGLSSEKPNVSKAYPGPTHIQILDVRETPEDIVEEQTLLQELVDLSGANWRGFNAKSAPVSVFYCHLVADFVHDFYESNLPLPAQNDSHPWFL